MIEHDFTKHITDVLEKYFPKKSKDIFEKSYLLQYLNLKTRSINKGAKARSSFANIYAIYVVIEDYLNKGFDKNKNYSKYEGAEFMQLFKRQRELPFGSKLQNHALNNRANSEFQGFFKSTELVPIIRNTETNRYWINENLLKVSLLDNEYNIAQAVKEIIEKYIELKKDSFERFLKNCIQIQNMAGKNDKEVLSFIVGLIAPNVDARIFEIVSYAILKYFYIDQKIYWGYELENIKKESLLLFKTGRTNANDGGIDFVMRPLGRFFQVTETLDVKKYFLDIDKTEHFPITFVIKSDEDTTLLQKKLSENAFKIYSIDSIVKKYTDCIEEVINIPILIERFNEGVSKGYLNKIMEEIITQSKIEFNYNEDDE